MHFTLLTLVLLFSSITSHNTNTNTKKRKSPDDELNVQFSGGTAWELDPFMKQVIVAVFAEIDTNKDNYIDDLELYNWIANVTRRSSRMKTDQYWVSINPEGKPTISWSQYVMRTYGFSPADASLLTGYYWQYAAAIRQDRRRFTAADRNHDSRLNWSEFHDFLNPEEKSHMRETIIDEMMEVLDGDRDGYLSEDEYLMGIARAYRYSMRRTSPEPKWMTRERQQFQLYRDTDGDQRLDGTEVGEWSMPTNYDTIRAETDHLFFNLDRDRDGLLTLGEILRDEQTFVQSKAMDHGALIEVYPMA